MKIYRFRWRPFTSLSLFIGGIVITVSGIALYVAPHHHLADLMDWRFLLLTRQQWWDLHLTSMIVFMVPFVFHLFKFNWKAFLHYMGRKSRGAVRNPVEVGLVLLVTVVLFWGTLADWKVTNWVLDLYEDIRIAYSQNWQEKKADAQLDVLTAPPQNNPEQ